MQASSTVCVAADHSGGIISACYPVPTTVHDRHDVHQALPAGSGMLTRSRLLRNMLRV
mgnify:FL=1